jgi:ankyrin repeat protein
VNQLVALGASVNEKDWHGSTPLHISSHNCHLHIIDRLVELGASVNEKDRNGNTPLLLAVNERRIPTVMALLRHANAFTDQVINIPGLHIYRDKAEGTLLALLAYGSSCTASNSEVLEVVSSWCPFQVVFGPCIYRCLGLMSFMSRMIGK